MGTVLSGMTLHAQSFVIGFPCKMQCGGDVPLGNTMQHGATRGDQSVNLLNFEWVNLNARECCVTVVQKPPKGVGT